MPAPPTAGDVHSRLRELVQAAVIAAISRQQQQDDVVSPAPLTADLLHARNVFQLHHKRNHQYISYAARKCAALLSSSSPSPPSHIQLADHFIAEIRHQLQQTAEYGDLQSATVSNSDGFICIELPASIASSSPSPSPPPASPPSSLVTFPSFPSSASPSSALYALPSIGVFRSVFSEKYGTPRQGRLCPSSVGCVQLHDSVPLDALQSLQSFSHVWVLFLFHLALPDTLKPKVRPPRLQGGKVGLFASRSPHRPCPIGLSVCRLQRVDGRRLLLSGVDAVDGSPVLDVKPYHPADRVEDASFPDWVREPAEAETAATQGRRLTVRVEQAVSEQVTGWAQAGRLQYYADGAAAVRAMEECIATDPRTLNAKAKHRYTYGTIRTEGEDRGGDEAEAEGEEEQGKREEELQQDEEKTAAHAGHGEGDGGQGSGDVIYGITLDRMDVAFRVEWSEAEETQLASVFHVDLYAEHEQRVKLRTRDWYARMRRISAEQRSQQPVT